MRDGLARQEIGSERIGGGIEEGARHAQHREDDENRPDGAGGREGKDDERHRTQNFDEQHSRP